MECVCVCVSDSYTVPVVTPTVSRWSEFRSPRGDVLRGVVVRGAVWSWWCPKFGDRAHVRKMRQNEADEAFSTLQKKKKNLKKNASSPHFLNIS